MVSLKATIVRVIFRVASLQVTVFRVLLRICLGWLPLKPPFSYLCRSPQVMFVRPKASKAWGLYVRVNIRPPLSGSFQGSRGVRPSEKKKTPRGDTGTGKTSVVQHVGRLLGREAPPLFFFFFFFSFFSGAVSAPPKVV